MHLRAAVFPIPPYGYPPTDQNKRAYGPISTLFITIADKLNSTYDILMTSDQCTISSKLPNGSWTAFRGMIDKNETDIALGPEVLVPGQLDGVRVGNSYHYYTFHFFASAGDPAEADFSNVVMTFDLMVWLILLVLLFVLALSCSVFDFADDYFIGIRPKSKSAVLEKNIWMFLASFFLEGTPREPTNQKNRFVFGVWLMAVLIMMNAFSSLFKSALMVKGPDDTMYTMKDLSERPDLTIQFRKSGFEEKYFEESPLKEYQKIWRNILAQGKRGLNHGSYFLERESYDIVKSGMGVILSPKEIVKVMSQNYCPTMRGNRRFYFIKEEAFSGFFLFYTSLSFPDDLFREINKRVRWIVEANLFLRWLEPTYKDYAIKCATSESSITHENMGLGLEHLKTLFFLTLFLQSSCFVVLVIEIIIHKITKCHGHFGTHNPDVI